MTQFFAIKALTNHELDKVSGGNMSADGKTFSTIVWKFGDTKVGISVTDTGNGVMGCTTVSGPAGHGGGCTVPV
jgi:bacteriocin-like protein